MADASMKVLVLTTSCPFGREEVWVEEEATYWPADLEFTVVPFTMPGPLRPLPAGVGLDTSVARYRTRWRKVAATAAACVHPVLVREIAELARHRLLTPRRVASSVRVIGQTLLIRRGLRRVLDAVTGDVAVYSYWHSPGTYAAVLLKRAGKVQAVVSRGHGSDVYEAITPARWHPLKRQLIADIDHTWTVSQDGAGELVSRYGAPADRVSVARLGVTVPEQLGPSPGLDGFRVLSVSSCVPLKQVPLIGRAIARFATAHPNAAVRWTHLGDGPEWQQVEEQLVDLVSTCPNLSWWTPGNVAHEKVLELLADQPFDVLVNASTSEGVPVSMMEAMSFGVPVIGPDVGGVRELVGPQTGWLLPPAVSEQELTEALEDVYMTRGSPARREAARRHVEQQFDSAANYRRFVAELVRQLQPAGA